MYVSFEKRYLLFGLGALRRFKQCNAVETAESIHLQSEFRSTIFVTCFLIKTTD
jgi:hypothetical protein